MRHMSKKIQLLSACLSILSYGSIAIAELPRRYHVEQISFPQLGQQVSVPMGISSTGEICGYLQYLSPDGYEMVPFVRSSERSVRVFSHLSGGCVAINSREDLLLYGATVGDSTGRHAISVGGVADSERTMTAIPGQAPDEQWAAGNSLNDDGIVVGDVLVHFSPLGFANAAALWSIGSEGLSEEPTLLPPEVSTGHSYSADAINSHKDILIRELLGLNGLADAHILLSDGQTRSIPHVEGTRGFSLTPMMMNDKGWIVGKTDDRRPFFYRDGRSSVIATPRGFPQFARRPIGISNQGIVAISPLRPGVAKQAPYVFDIETGESAALNSLIGRNQPAVDMITAAGLDGKLIAYGAPTRSKDPQSNTQEPIVWYLLTPE